MGEKGLNWSLQVSVFGPAVLGPAACETAVTKTTPVRPRNNRDLAAMRTVLRMTPPPDGGRRRPAPRVRLSPGPGFDEAIARAIIPSLSPAAAVSRELSGSPSTPS